MDRLVNIKYIDNFVFIIKVRNESSVEEFKELINGIII